MPGASEFGKRVCLWIFWEATAPAEGMLQAGFFGIGNRESDQVFWDHFDCKLMCTWSSRYIKISFEDNSKIQFKTLPHLQEVSNLWGEWQFAGDQGWCKYVWWPQHDIPPFLRQLFRGNLQPSGCGRFAALGGCQRARGGRSWRSWSFLHRRPRFVDACKNHQKHRILWCTPLKFNMEPENQHLEKEIPFGNHHFQVPC